MTIATAPGRGLGRTAGSPFWPSGRQDPPNSKLAFEQAGTLFDWLNTIGTAVVFETRSRSPLLKQLTNSKPRPIP